MQENDFEKQVHQKMGALRVLPSETVWEQVAMRLHRNEKRRRWFIWFPLLLTGLSLFGYFAFYPGHAIHSKELQGSSHYPSKELSTINAVPRSSKGISIPVDYSKKNYPVDTGNGKTGYDSIGTATLNDQGLKSKDLIHAVQPTTTPAPKVTMAVPDSTSPANPSVIVRNTDEIITGKNNSGLANSLSINETSYAAIAPVEITPSTNKVQNNLLINGDAGEELESAAINALPLIKAEVHTTLSVLKENQLVKITTTYGENRGWAWGVSFLGGRSSITNGSFNKVFSGSIDNFASPNQFTNNGSSPGNALYAEPYPTRAYAGFSAGTFLKKRLSARFSISLGLNYTVFSTTNRVGKRIDSVIFVNSRIAANRQEVTGYFRIGDAGSYTNKYHYVEMPLMVQTTLAKNWKLPIYWDLGFSVSRLLTSNALHFDNVAGVYYQGNQLLNKTQVNIITALPVKLSSRKKLDLQVGPQLQYGLSNIVTTQKTSGNHFLFGGIKATVLLGKK